jgi:cell fate (sporulation/competence/biofilm development) regulator YlbF (YheA/YmcA/DUF963 family)
MKSNVHLKEQVVSLKARIMELECIIEDLENDLNVMRDEAKNVFIDGGL